MSFYVYVIEFFSPWLSQIITMYRSLDLLTNMIWDTLYIMSPITVYSSFM